MRRGIAVLAVGCLHVLTHAVRATPPPDTGAFLLEQCRKAAETRSSERWNREFCVGYVGGYVDGITAHSGAPLAFCLPPDSTAGKLVPVVISFLEEHPEALKLPRGEALEAALRERYPCGEAGP